MKTRVLNFCKAAVFLVLLVACILAAVVVVRRKESSYKYADFFDKAKENQIDVLFMGSSHVINAVNPATLYRNYGYTSYNIIDRKARVRSSLGFSKTDLGLPSSII